MFALEPLADHHLLALADRGLIETQAHIVDLLDVVDYRRTLLLSAPAHAVVACVSDEGPEGSGSIEVLGVGGVLVMPWASWRGIAWTLVGRDAPRRAWPFATVAGIRLVREALAGGLHEIECAVPWGFDAGRAWARRLGFHLGEPAMHQEPDGRYVYVYSRRAGHSRVGP